MTGAAEEQMGSLDSIATVSLLVASGGPLSCCFHVFIHRSILVCESLRLVIPQSLAHLTLAFPRGFL